MVTKPENEKDSVRLSGESAADLLARATQLDAALAGKVSVAELRQAARDAGIAPEAFEQALAEHQAASAAVNVKPAEGGRRRRFWVLGVVLTAALLTFLFLGRIMVSTP